MVWCLCTKPLLSLSQINGWDSEAVFDCNKDCEGYYKHFKELWEKDTTDSIYRYKPFSHGNRYNKSRFLSLIVNYPKCCIEGQPKSKVISLLGKPDAIVKNDSTFEYFYFFKKSTFKEYIVKKDEIFKIKKELNAIRVSLDCNTKKVIKLGTR